jgi:hypothetical protein
MNLLWKFELKNPTDGVVVAGLVAAPTEKDARRLLYEYDGQDKDWLNPDLSSCTQINIDGEPRVLLTDSWSEL